VVMPDADAGRHLLEDSRCTTCTKGMHFKRYCTSSPSVLAILFKLKNSGSFPAKTAV
jgi:hypothetical protein